jgi:pilus assembly protein CpaB
MKQKNLVLMVVAVGCGLVAAFLTSQMSARSTAVEQVDVIVAAKDLPVGTLLTREDLKTKIKQKRVPKDGLPPAYVIDPNELVDKRLSRSVRAEETFNPADLTKGGVITLPPGMDMVSLQVSLPQAVSGFVAPGARVDVLATVRLHNKLLAFPLLVNMLVVAVDNTTQIPKENGVFQTVNTVSFAVDRKQALLLALAKSRGCALELLLRHPEKASQAEENYDIDRVIKLLQDDRSKAVVDNPDEDPEATRPKAEPKVPETSPPPPEPMVRVLVAAENIPAGTQITNDLIAEKFRVKEFRKQDVEDAFAEADLKQHVGKTLVTGLGKGQWVTGALVGDPGAKPSPRAEFTPDKGGPAAEQPKPAPAPPRRTHDVQLHTGSGTKTFRYEEVKPGQWKLMGEVPSGGRARDADRKVD